MWWDFFEQVTMAPAALFWACRMGVHSKYGPTYSLVSRSRDDVGCQAHFISTALLPLIYAFISCCSWREHGFNTRHRKVQQLKYFHVNTQTPIQSLALLRQKLDLSQSKLFIGVNVTPTGGTHLFGGRVYMLTDVRTINSCQRLTHTHKGNPLKPIFLGYDAGLSNMLFTL